MAESAQNTKILAKKTSSSAKEIDGSDHPPGSPIDFHNSGDSFSYQTFSNPPDLIVGPRGQPHHRDEEYEAVVQEAERAIAMEMLPELIHQGSSGSYWVKNSARVCHIVRYKCMKCNSIFNGS